MKWLELLGIWNYVILAFLVFIEGPTATLVGAAAAATGVLDPLAVFGVAAASNLAADSFWYSLGRWGGRVNILRWARRLGVQEETIVRYQASMRSHGLKILLAAKLTLSFSIPALIAAGLAHVPWRKAIVVLAAAETLWSGSLVLAGMYLGYRLARLEQGLQIAAVAGSILFLLFLVALLKHQGRHLVDEGSPSR